MKREKPECTDFSGTYELKIMAQLESGTRMQTGAAEASLSSGIYTMLSGIIPLFFCMGLDIWLDGGLKKKFNKKHLLLIISTLCAFGIGYLFYKRLFTGFSRTETLFNTSELFTDNILSYFKGFFLLFGAIPQGDLKVLTVTGISYLVKSLFVFLLLYIFIKNIPGLFCPCDSIDSGKYLLSVFLFTVYIIFTSRTRYSTDTIIQYRYMLIGAIPLVMLLGKEISSFSESWNNFQTISGFGVLLICMIFLIYGNNKNVMAYFHNNDNLVKIMRFLDDTESASVIYVNDEDYMNKSKGLDDGRIYGCYNSLEQSLVLPSNSYTYARDTDFYAPESPSVLVCYIYTTPYDLLPEEAASQYVYIGNVEYFELYISPGFFL